MLPRRVPWYHRVVLPRRSLPGSLPNTFQQRAKITQVQHQQRRHVGETTYQSPELLKQVTAAKLKKFSYFLAIPVGNSKSFPQLQADLRLLRERGQAALIRLRRKDIANGSWDRYDTFKVVDDMLNSMYSPGMLHLTLGSLKCAVESFGDPEDKLYLWKYDDVIDFLHGSEFKREMQDVMPDPSVPVMAELGPLECMATLRNGSIIYTTPKDPTGRLEQYCLRLGHVLRKHRILHRPKDIEFKLHVTLARYPTERLRDLYDSVHTRIQDGRIDGKIRVAQAKSREAAVPSFSSSKAASSFVGEMTIAGLIPDQKLSESTGKMARRFRRDLQDFIAEMKQFKVAEQVLFDRMVIWPSIEWHKWALTEMRALQDKWKYDTRASFRLAGS